MSCSFYTLCAGTVVVAMRVVGVILTAALIITPAATARLICHSLLGTTLCAMAIGILGGLGGMLCAFHFDLSMGASIVLFISAIFLVTRIWSGALGRG